MKKYTKYIVLIVAIFAFNSCFDADIETISTQELASEFYQTDAQVSMALTAAYDPIGWVWNVNGELWGGSLKTWGNFASDDAYAGGNDENDQPTYQAAHSYTVSPADPASNLFSFCMCSVS